MGQGQQDSPNMGPETTGAYFQDTAELVTHVRNWTNERPPGDERKARSVIANAIESDISYPIGEQETPRRVRGYRMAVAGVNQETIATLEESMDSSSGGLAVYEIEGRGLRVVGTDPRYPNRDTVTGASFLTRVIREQDAWVAEEVDADTGDLISQARLYDDYRPSELLLSFTSDHYIQQAADLMLTGPDYPTGANATFLYLTGSLGLVKWRNPFERAAGKITAALQRDQ